MAPKEKSANGKKLQQKYQYATCQNMTSNKKVNVYRYYTQYKKIKFIYVCTVPFVYIHISQKPDVQR
jgi:hypothetical protein